MVQLGEGTRDTRRRVALADLCGQSVTEAQVLAVLRPFANDRARLVTLSALKPEEPTITVEVTHETLFEHWTELRKWIDESRADRRFYDRIAEATKLWAADNRPPGRQWRPPDLDLLRDYVTRRPDDLGSAEFAFYDASSRQELAEKAGKEEAERKLREAYEQLRQQLLSTYAERGRQLLQQGDCLPALLWLQRAYEQGFLGTSLKQLLAEAMRPVDAVLQVLVGHEAGVVQACFSPDGAQLVTASDDSTARLWDAHTGKLLACLQHTGKVKHAAFSPDGTQVVTASHDQTARLWDVKTAKPTVSLKGHTASILHAAFSPDGAWVITAGWDKTARLWDAQSGDSVVSFHGHQASVWHAAFSPDGTYVVTASEDNTARVWGTKTGQLLSALRGHSATVAHAAFSPDGARVLTASYDKTARLWDAQTGRPLSTFHGHLGILWHACFSQDGSRVLTASDDHTARLWDSQTGHLLASLRGHESTVWYAAFSPDGARVVTASEDTTARLWDAKVGHQLVSFQGHAATVGYVTFNCDGTRVVTASEDRTARLWDAKTGQFLVALQGHTASVRHATFSPDGTRVVTASEDSTARLWDVHLEARTAVQIATSIRRRVPFGFQGDVIVPTTLVVSSQDLPGAGDDRADGGSQRRPRGPRSDTDAGIDEGVGGGLAGGLSTAAVRLGIIDQRHPTFEDADDATSPDSPGQASERAL